MTCKQISVLLEISAEKSDVKYIKDDFTINSDQVDFLLSETACVLDNFEDCLRVKRQIDPIITESSCVLHDKEAFFQSFRIYSKFTSLTAELIGIFEAFAADPEKNVIETLLQTFSILEFSLGNVYKTKTGRTPPHLLKDLLQELSKFFQCKTIFLLQLVAGTSHGVNLRNLVWHGFLDSVDVRFATFTFVIINSIGKTLRSEEIISTIRPDIELQEFSLGNCLPNFEEILTSPTIRRNHYKIWIKIFDLRNSGHTRPSAYLLLSQIENVLRSIYGELNGLEVSARMNKYYVIIDSIFYDYVLDDSTIPLVIGKINNSHELCIKKSNKRNRFVEKFPRALICLGFDLFHAADGPRIRDKLSHGEAVMTDVQSDTVWMLLIQFISKVVKFHDSGENSSFNHESIFMNNFKLVRKHNQACDNFVKLFESFEVPEGLEKETLVFNNDSMRLLTSKNLKFYFRPLDESQIVKSILKILENFSESLRHFSSSCNEFFKLFKERKLSSSRRQSLVHLISCLPNFYLGFHGILNVTFDAFVKCQQIDDDKIELDSSEIVRLLKQTLKFCENLVKNFTHSSRNFFVANQNTCEFLQLIDKCKCLPLEEYI